MVAFLINEWSARWMLELTELEVSYQNCDEHARSLIFARSIYPAHEAKLLLFS